MSRKVPSFGQLIGYIDRDEGHERWRIRHNVMARDPDRIRGEFEQNGALLSKRKNGVYLYHEIISITRAAGISDETQKARLQEIAETYVAARCPDNLVYGGLHQDKEHSFHYHLMISANRAGDSRRLRLTKAQFREVQVQLERHVLQTMPELEQKVAIDKRAERRKSRAEAELERRTGEVPKKDQLRARVLEALEGGSDRDALLQAFGRFELELYVRGKTLGVIDLETGEKHRLKTLDLELLDRVEGVMRTDPESREKTAFADEKEKAPEAQTERDASKQETEDQKSQEATREQEDEMLGKQYTTTPETPSPERKEKIDRDEITPDPLRDKMSHEDWKKQDSFLHKLKASFVRTGDDFRRAISPESEKNQEPQKPERAEPSRGQEQERSGSSPKQRAWREEIEARRNQAKGRDDSDRERD